MKKLDFLSNEKIWRYLADFWTISFFAFLIFDFSVGNSYDFLLGPLAAIYVGILGLYVSTKEFNRWRDYHDSKHPGEIYILIWTLVIFAIFLINIFINHSFKICSELIAVYLTVLGVFAITQKSKNLHIAKKNKRKNK